MRRVRVINIPGKNVCQTPDQKRKRQWLKRLCLSLNQEITLANFQDALFLPKKEKLVFAPLRVSTDILTYHLPAFQVFELKEESRALRLWFLSLAARIHQKRLRDGSGGVAVFVNIPNPMSVRIYHRLHPARRIVIRLHDGIGDYANTGAERIRSMIRQLKDEGAVADVETYCRKDAERCGLTYRPNGVDPRAMKRLETNRREFL